MSGFNDLDKVTGGFQPGEMIVMSGVPGVGKSMLAMQIALQVSKNIPTVIYSLEMTKELVYRRMVSGVGKIDALHLKNGMMSQEEIQKYKDASAEIGSRALYIADGGGWDLLTIKADIMKHKIRHGIQFGVIDYLYLIGDMANETDEVARTTVLARGVKRIAMELEIPLLVVHSMNKAGMDNSGVPGLSSLRGSGQGGYDSDMVLMLTKYNDSMGNLFLPQSELENIRGLFFVKGRDMPPMSKFVQLVKNPNYPDFRESVKR
jgi:replicative DNA helicase